VTRASLLPPLVLLALTPLASAQRSPLLAPALDRVSEEAEAFQRVAPKIIGRETLRHKGRQAPPRIRWLSLGKPPELTYRTAVIVSEYGFGRFAEAPDDLREFRQVVSVDGRARAAAATRDARQVLAENMTSDDDRLRRRLLEDFEKFGQTGSATDFGQMVLLFRKRSLGSYEFERKKDAPLNGEPCQVIHWKQRPGVDPLHVFSNRRLQRIPMEGELWLRARDLMPLRITMKAALEEESVPVTYVAEIDYERSRYGLLLPVAVHMEKKARGLMMIDNHSEYGDYQMFGADSQILFDATGAAEEVPAAKAP
jgi:hypothetical protein